MFYLCHTSNIRTIIRDSKLFLTCCICCIYTYRLMQYCEERRSFELFPICINDISINVNSKVLFILKLIN